MSGQQYKMQRDMIKVLRISILFRSVLFATKLRLTVRRFRKRRQLTKEWIDIENSNEVYVSSIKDAMNRLTLDGYQKEVISVGLNSILQQSKAVREKLRAIIKSKGIVFGSVIKEICSSFQVYQEYLSKYLQKQKIISELSSQAFQQGKHQLLNRGFYDLKSALNENTQKLIFRTYNISLLLSGFLKCLDKNSQESKYFQIAINIMLKLNKKYDRLLKKEKKEMELERIVKINGSFKGCCFLASIKAQMNFGSVLLHIFETIIGIEAKGDIQIVNIERYSSIFIKTDNSQKIVCLITKQKILHFLFETTQDLNRFFKIVQSCIQGIATERSITQSQLISTFEPFILAQVCDYRQSIDLKSNKDTYIQIIFASIKHFENNQQQNLIKKSMRQSMQWAELKDSQYNNQINEVVTLTLDDLSQIKQLWSKQYQAVTAFPKYNSFSGRIQSDALKLLEWQTFLNTILRSRIFINNPILLLKKMQVTDIFLETSQAQGQFQAQNEEEPHCRLCSRILVNEMSRYLAIRLDFLRKKYQQKSNQYCYLIFQQIRKEVCKISIYQLMEYYELIIWLQFRKGSIDYSFRRITEANKSYYVDVTILSIFQVNFQVLVNKSTLVSDVLDQVYLMNDISCLPGYRLVLHFSDKELILRPNELILPLLQYYNIKLDKLYKPSFFSTIGKLLQLSQKGILVLKPILFYPLCPEQALAVVWEQQYNQYQFKSDRLIGLDRKHKVEIAILLSIEEMLGLNKQLPQILSLSRFNKFIPISLEEEGDDINEYIQDIYSKFVKKSLKDITSMLDSRFSQSPLFKTYIFEVKIIEASANIEGQKKLSSLIFGIGWKGVIFSTLYEKIIFKYQWWQLQVQLDRKGIKIQSDVTYLIIKCPRLLQIFRILKDYQNIISMSDYIKQK